MLHIYVFLVTPLGARIPHGVAGRKPAKSRVFIRETARQLGTAQISRFNLSMTLLVGIRAQCSLGKSQ